MNKPDKSSLFDECVHGNRQACDDLKQIVREASEAVKGAMDIRTSRKAKHDRKNEKSRD